MKKLLILSLISTITCAELPKMSDMFVLASVAMPAAGLYMSYDAVKKWRKLESPYTELKGGNARKDTANAIGRGTPGFNDADKLAQAEQIMRSLEPRTLNNKTSSLTIPEYNKATSKLYAQFAGGLLLTGGWIAGIKYFFFNK